ncbi:MAG: cation transporting ATPase C-terminal domain-containing protein, partial [Candidatus Diapherotrites archaeon]|nr:cation transporting ATPase C-terminal domain-containing protein [Candidatus Diapherotrites archaeon]
TISANFGNMTTVAASSLFLPFIPLLPSQILLNNFVSDVPLLTVSTDNVDSEFLRKPKHWNLRFIGRIMVYFGAISTVFDLLLIGGLLFLFNSGTALFRTAWFVESALSEIIVTFAIRTKRPFFKSRPSKFLLLSSLQTIFVTVGITYLAFGAQFFEFVPMPLDVLLFIGVILAAYFATAEIAKRRFFAHAEI